MLKRIILVLMLTLSILSIWANIKYSLVNVPCSSQFEMQNLITKGFDVQINQGIKNNYVKLIANQFELKRLTDLSYNYEVIHEDYTKFLQTRLKQPSVRTTQLGQGSMGGYFTYEEVVEFVDSLYAQYSNIMSNPQIIGSTIEGRQIKAYKISDNPNNNENEPEALIIGLHHAREGMSIVAPLYYTQWLLENYNSNPLATYLVNNREIWFVPILNIDGYVYNQEIAPNGGGMWRKNKHDNNNNNTFNPEIDGVDLNRNYGYEWGFDDTGSSPQPNTETYRGPFAFSELETQAIRDFCNTNNFKTALSFHTFGDLFIYTEHANGEPVPDTELLREYAVTMTKNNGYVYGNGTETVNYSTNGDSDAWMYGEQTTKPKIISYTPEIGDESDNFWAPTDRIIPLAMENLFPQIYISLIAGSYLEIQNSRVNDTIGGDGNLFGEAGESFDIYFKVKNKSWDEGISNVTANLSCNSPLVTINNANYSIQNLNALEETEIHFNITLSNQIVSGQQIEFNVNFNNANTYNLTEHFLQTFGTPIVLFYDDAESGMTNWENGLSWDTSNEKANSGQKSFTDSPEQNYPNNILNRMEMLNPINLNSMNNAFVKYQIRWNLEKHFDKLQIELKNNNNWIPLSASYTTYGTGIGVQQTGEPLYNGFRDLQWFDEKVEIPSQYLNNQFRIAYCLQSDEGVTSDGAYIDDIMVIAYTDNQMPPQFAYVSNNLENTSFTGPFPIKTVVSDPQGINQVILKYSTNNVDFSNISMVEGDRHIFNANIPILSLGSTVYYYIQASDNEGNSVDSEHFSFMITNNPPNIALNINNLELNMDGPGISSSSFEILNNGFLPLDLNIFVTSGENSRKAKPAINKQNLINKLKDIKISPDHKTKKEYSLKNNREMELLIQDTTGELANIYPDIESIYAEMANNNLNLEIFLANEIDWGSTLMLISFDTDQNINTGSYPPSFGVGNEFQDIGSDYEMVVDCGNIIGNGVGSFILDFNQENFIGSANMNLTENSIQISFPYSLLNDNDNNLDITALALPSQTSNEIDFAPNQGHGTIGINGTPSWLSFTPNNAHLQYNIPFYVLVEANSGLIQNGSYHADMHIESNDPDQASIILPITFNVTGMAIEDNSLASSKNCLLPNYPNPFNPDTFIQFNIDKKSHVEIDIYNIKGQKIKQLTNNPFNSGTHKLLWNGTDTLGKKVSSGIYFCKMKINNKTVSNRKMLLLK